VVYALLAAKAETMMKLIVTESLRARLYVLVVRDMMMALYASTPRRARSADLIADHMPHHLPDTERSSGLFAGKREKEQKRARRDEEQDAKVRVCVDRRSEPEGEEWGD